MMWQYKFLGASGKPPRDGPMGMNYRCRLWLGLAGLHIGWRCSEKHGGNLIVCIAAIYIYTSSRKLEIIYMTWLIFNSIPGSYAWSSLIIPLCTWKINVFDSSPLVSSTLSFRLFLDEISIVCQFRNIIHQNEL